MPSKELEIAGTVMEDAVHFNDTASASSQESILISMMTQLCQFSRINFDFNDTACASLQESILISMTQPVPVLKNQF